MNRLRLRILIIFISFGLLATLAGYLNWRNRSGALDLLSLQGVPVCATSRDTQSGSQRCPSPTRFITNCEEAKTAIQALSSLHLRPELDPSLQPATYTDCEWSTVSQDQQLYALVIHTYYPTSSPEPLTVDDTRRQASASLYNTYNNYYQSYLSLEPTVLSLPAGSPTPSLYRAFAPAFLIHGEPGFKMAVQLEDQDGHPAPGKGTLLKVSCGKNSDTMTAEASGESWFSFAGYERLRCGTQPLSVQAVNQLDADGHWISGTAGYNYLYEPNSNQRLTLQSRAQAVQVDFIGKWQGIGIKVQIKTLGGDGSWHSYPLAKTKVSLTCVSATKGLFGPPSWDQSSDSRGLIRVSLADAQRRLNNCPADQFQANLSQYDSAHGAASEQDPTYPYYFATSSPVPAGRISGASFSSGILEGSELQLGGIVGLADVGSTPGGLLAAGSQICLFYTLDAAKNFGKGCPDSKSSTPTSLALSVRGGKNGHYIFSSTTNSQLSYGDYLKSGSSPVLVRILDYHGNAYPDTLIDKNSTPLDPTQVNSRDIHLPSSVDDLHDHVCLSIQQIWHDTKECQPMFNIIDRESRWNAAATNGSSGACGLFQALPCSKYAATALPDEPYNAVGNQIYWGIKYVKDRYNTPTEAWAFWQGHNYY